MHIVSLHGAMLDKASMRPISDAMASFLPVDSQFYLELPGHGSREGDLAQGFALSDLVEDALISIAREFGSVPWSDIVFVGESTGALVLAALVKQLETPPLAMVLGEPPLTNGHGMRQVRSQLMHLSSPPAIGLRRDLFGFEPEKGCDYKPFISSPSCPTLLVYGGLADSSAKAPVHSVILSEEIAAIPNHPDLIRCKVELGGHRILQTYGLHWALMLKGILASAGLGDQSTSLLSY